MGRSKSKPTKRQRIEEDEAAAIALLKQAPQEQVEKAAADATRQAVQEFWPRLKIVTGNEDTIKDDSDEGVPSINNDISTVPVWANGLGTSRRLDAAAFQTLKQLHDTITEQSPKSSWSGSPTDPRQRAFGFLPDTLGYDATVRQRLDISMPWRAGEGHQEEDKGKQSGETDAAASMEEEEERRRNEQAMVLLEKVPDGTKEAIEHVCALFRECVKESSSKNDDSNVCLANFLQYRNLIAAQPNLHNGRELLPMHFDHPSKDGFGVIIVTISIRGSGLILLQDSQGEQRLAMPLQAGEAYMLADQARDACVHGVLTDMGKDHRESLNLRFGLHDMAIHVGTDGDTINICVCASKVLKHWETSL
jgi:hypothetical protein